MMDNRTGKIGTCADPKIDDETENLSDHYRTNRDRTYKPEVGFRRYSNAIKNLIPIRMEKKAEETLAINSAGLLSIITFSWLSEIMYKTYRAGITIEELPNLSPIDAATYNAKRMELMWKKELSKNGEEKASFSRVVWRFCRTRVLAASLIFTCSLFLSFLSYTYAMRRLLEYVQTGNGSIEEGVKWALILTATETFRTLFMAWTWALNYRTAMRLKSACLALVYGKIIRVDNLGNQSIGKVINVFTNDAETIYELISVGPLGIGAPIATIFGVFYIVWLLSPMALIGMIVLFLTFPIQYMISRLNGYFQNKGMKVSDMRIRLVNEILDCIKLIKMYAWEDRFKKDILDLRKSEQGLLFKTWYCRNLGPAIAPATSVISVIIAFLAHVSVGNGLTAAQAFSYTTFLDSGLGLLLFFFQASIYRMTSARISFNRIKSLLLLKDGNCQVCKPTQESQAVVIKRGTFAYNIFDDSKVISAKAVNKKRINENTDSVDEGKHEKLNKPTDCADHVNILFDISFEVEKGKLVGICGQVGSGKSSLLLAALGQLRVLEGQVMRDGSCAYVSQQAWITNATLKENILFGSKFDHSRYHKAIHACNLVQDIEMMPGGDETEIGEKGVNLSGGQKQRVALARALYADRDIYFLDDPLSAVDSRVGSYIFHNLILKALKGKTVLFVTHQIQYLNRCDEIYLMRDGKIIEHGTHDVLMQLDNDYALMVSAISTESKTDNSETIVDQKITALLQTDEDVPLHQENRSRIGSITSNVSTKSVERLNIPNAQLTVAEDLQQGAIKAQAYHMYIMAAGGYFTALLVLLSFLATAISITFSAWWLAFWINAGSGNATVMRNNETIHSDKINDNPDFWYYQTIYASTIGFIVLTSALHTVIYTKTIIGASTKMHNDLFKTIISSPIRFFDTTPSGRIQHLFSRDMDEVDSRLPFSLNSITNNVISIFFAILAVCVVIPWFILPLCILAAPYYFVSRIFRVAIRDLKRMDNKTRAPIISFITATVQGLATIHAFGKENDFTSKFTKLFDENTKCSTLYIGAMRWLAVRIDLLTVAITAATAFLIVTLQTQISPALAGLALFYSAHISDTFQFTIRLLSDSEVRFISVERISHYIMSLKNEGCEHRATIEPSPSWPVGAKIKFINVDMAYGEGAPVILKNVSFSIEAGEKIGIIGRTGSGKSSLTVALFRLAELAEGKIEIDDIDISAISLRKLRTKLSIIPQDPVLFSGTIRSNLDPFNLYTDVEIWNALEKTELKNRVQSIAGQLDAPVGFGGDNMSVGERQLLCLARALLRNSKILILDEATAGVDPETEIAVQNTVQQEFSGCTILTIAHRLQTVLSLDRILVMDSGKVLEFDTPSNLLADPNSEFSKMMAAAEQAEGQQKSHSTD